MLEASVHVDRSHTAESKDHDTRQAHAGSRDEVTEVEIVNEKDSILLLSECENLLVLQLLLASVDEVISLVPSLVQERYGLGTNPHVGQKSHATSSVFSSASHAAYWSAC